MTDGKIQRKRLEKLIKYGPLTESELDGRISGVYYRERGVRRFNPNKKSEFSQCGRHGRAVYYVDGEHEPVDVIKKWMEVNEHIVELANTRSLHYRFAAQGSAFKEASRSLLDMESAFGGGEGRDTSGGECPLCGEEYDNSLPRHLPCGSGGDDE